MTTKDEILDKFRDLGMSASFHYADDTASGEWRLGSSLESTARELFKENPELQPAMREISRSFLWSL